MLTLPVPKLVNQSAIVPKPKLVPKDNVELGEVSIRKKLTLRLMVLGVFYYYFF